MGFKRPEVQILSPRPRKQPHAIKACGCFLRFILFISVQIWLIKASKRSAWYGALLTPLRLSSPNGPSRSNPKESTDPKTGALKSLSFPQCSTLIAASRLLSGYAGGQKLVDGSQYVLQPFILLPKQCILAAHFAPFLRRWVVFRQSSHPHYTEIDEDVTVEVALEPSYFFA